MAKMTDSEFLAIVIKDKDAAKDYRQEVGEKRSVLMDYYNMMPYGDEVEGQSSFCSSDVSDVVEGMLPSLIRPFTQARNVAEFTADRPEYDDEAMQKTEISNYVFFRQNPGVLTLTSMFKDALLQYTGTVKVFWDDDKEVTEERYEGLSLDELNKLKVDEESEVYDEEPDDDDVIQSYSCRVKRTRECGYVRYENIPPEEFLISRNARNFIKPQLIGHTALTTRSDLIAMGFDREIVDGLPAYTSDEKNSREKTARYGSSQENYQSSHKATDMLELSELYMYIDADDDGIAELWQVFEASNTLLERNVWDVHPFSVVTPIPIPHKAIGTCPADEVADIQYTKSVLGRQALNNIYQTNYTRIAHNDRVDMDDLLTIRAGGTVLVEGEGPVMDALMPIITQPQVDQILQMIEYVDASAERRTGFTRYSQGLDPDALNQTATGFKGITEYSQQRMELIAKVFAEGVKDIFTKTVMLISKYQEESMQVKVSGAALEINPTDWRHNLSCSINVGLGSGDRGEKISGLNNILMLQKEAAMTGSVLADESKIYNTLEKLITEIGLKDVSLYFNDPSKPEEVLLAQNEQMQQMIEQLQQQVQTNPLAEAETIRAQAKMIESQSSAKQADQKDLLKLKEMENDMKQFMLTLKQNEDKMDSDTIKYFTELELKYGQNVPGSAV